MPPKKIKQKSMRLRSIPASSQSTVHSRFKRRERVRGPYSSTRVLQARDRRGMDRGQGTVDLLHQQITFPNKQHCRKESPVIEVCFLIEKVGEISWAP